MENSISLTACLSSISGSSIPSTSSPKFAEMMSLIRLNNPIAAPLSNQIENPVGIDSDSLSATPHRNRRGQEQHCSHAANKPAQVSQIRPTQTAQQHRAQLEQRICQAQSQSAPLTGPPTYDPEQPIARPF